MWAMMPMFRVRASGNSRITRFLVPDWRPLTSSTASAITIFSAGSAITEPPSHGTPGQRARHERASRSPPVVRERLDRLRHLVHVLSALHRRPLPLRGVHQLADEARRHRVLAPLPREVDDPAKRQRRAAVRPDLNRDLVCRAADPPRAHLEQWPDVLDRLLKREHRIVRCLLADALERLVDGALGERLLAVQQHLVYELSDERVLVDGVRVDLAAYGRALARH